MADPTPTSTPSHVRTVGILLFPDVEVLDFAGPFEVFSVAQLPDTPGRPERDQHLFEVVTIAETAEVVRCRNGLLVQPTHTIANHPPLDIVVVPGGWGTRALQNHAPILAWIADQNRHTELTTSVCTGSFLLAGAGLLDDTSATTHWGSVDRMRELFPRVQVAADVRFVDAGHLLTSAGISAGIDMALHIVARLHGDAAAVATARIMEYDGWPATGLTV